MRFVFLILALSPLFVVGQEARLWKKYDLTKRTQGVTEKETLQKGEVKLSDNITLPKAELDSVIANYDTTFFNIQYIGDYNIVVSFENVSFNGDSIAITTIELDKGEYRTDPTYLACYSPKYGVLVRMKRCGDLSYCEMEYLIDIIDTNGDILSKNIDFYTLTNLVYPRYYFDIDKRD